MPKKENDQEQNSGPEEQEEFRLFDDEGNLNPDYEGPENAENEGTGISQAPPQADTDIKLNSWAYLDLQTTKIPKDIRNASDPAVVTAYRTEHDAELSDQEKEYLDHKQARQSVHNGNQDLQTEYKAEPQKNNMKPNGH